MSRPSGHDASDVQSKYPLHAMVHRVPSRSGETCAPQRSRIRSGLCDAGSGSRRNRAEAGSRVQDSESNGLSNVSPVKRMNKELPQYWRSLEELAQTAEFRAYV